MPEKYRERASDADQQARRARNEAERRAFLEIATLWRRLADHADACCAVSEPAD